MCRLTETRALSAQGEKRALVGNLTMPFSKLVTPKAQFPQHSGRIQQRVRLLVEPIDEGAGDRQAALGRLRAGIAHVQFFSKGREELHDRA